MPRVRAITAITGLCAALAVQPVSAELTTLETFDYNPANTLGSNSATAGMGFGAPWRVDAVTLSSVDVNAASLSIPGYPNTSPEGGSASFFGPNQLNGNTSQTSAYRNFSDFINLDADQDYFFTVLARRTGTGSMAVTLGAASTSKATFGISSGGNRNVSLTGGAAAPTETGGPIAADTTYLFVVKIDANTSGNDFIYLSTFAANPPGAEPGTLANPTPWDLAGGGFAGTGNISRFTFATNSNATPNETRSLTIDEIRIGTDYASVIPEPTAAFAAVALSAPLLRRRRR